MFFRKRKKANEQPSAQQDIEIARKALQQKDLEHAVHHVSAALAVDPENLQALALLDEIIRQTPKPLDLVPLESKMWHGTVATRAYIHFKLGEHALAISLLAQVLRATPDVSYLPWLVMWLSQSALPSEITSATLTPILAVLMGKYSMDLLVESDPARPYFEQLVPILLRIRTENPQDTMFAALSSVILRKLGQFDEAIQIALAAYQSQPNKRIGVILGKHYRVKGDKHEALRFCQQALVLDSPDDPLNADISLDVADLSLETGQYEQALVHYRKILEHEPEHAWAKPHSLYSQFKMTKDELCHEQLKQYVSAHRDNQEAAKLLKGIDHGLYPYIDHLPVEHEAIINTVLQIPRPENAPTDKELKLEIGLSALEAPSARLAVGRYLARYYNNIRLTLAVSRLQKPDPRIPYKPVDYVLWTYEGTDPKPTVVPPAEEIANTVADLAARPYSIYAWVKTAQETATRLGSECLPDLLSVMVHPPKEPPNVEPWDWIRYIQVAAALTIAHLNDGEWSQSGRRQALFSVACGPLDWTVEAAIIALTQVAIEDTQAGQEIQNLFSEMLDHLPDQGMVPYISALVMCPFRLPLLSSSLRAKIIERGKRYIHA